MHVHRVIVFIMMITLLLGGCTSSYKQYASYKTAKATVDAENRPWAVENVGVIIDYILGPIEQSARTQSSNAQETYLLKHTYIDINGDPVTITVGDVVSPIVSMFMERDIMVARVQAVKYLQPIIATIYNDMAESDAPVTTGDVMLKVAGNIPLLSTVLGMYGVSSVMANKVGTTIGDLAVNGNNTSIGLNNTGDVTATNGGGLPEEEEELEVELEDTDEPDSSD